MNEIILASASPRRSELLKQIGLSFRVCVSDCEEKITERLPERVVCELSGLKARNVWKKLKEERRAVCGGRCEAALAGRSREPHGGMEKAAEAEAEKRVVIGADTVVTYGGRILGKPSDKAEAAEMLTLLAGNTHQVYTGVTFCYQEDGAEKAHTFYEMTKVVLYPMSEEEIDHYIATGEPMDKAGAYGIQGFFASYVKEIHGDYNNVVGLPVGRVYQELKEKRLL